MPSPPQPNESEKSFIARCMKHFYEKEKDVPREQAAAICHSMFRRKGKKKK